MKSLSYFYVTSAVRSAYDYFLFILAPPFCMRCKKWLSSRHTFCVACERLIEPIVSATISLTENHDMKVYAISEYAEPLKSLILAKSRSDHLASRQLGELIWEKTVIKNQDFDAIVPVPLHWMRFAQRGYNQAEEMAKVIAHRSGKPIVKAIKRNRSTPFQSAVESTMRHQNVKRAFESTAQAHSLRGKHILLIDDVMTSGATLLAIGKELLKLKPASITAVVACRVR